MPETVKALKYGKRRGRGGGQIITPEDRFPRKAPPTLADMKAVRREMARVYRFVWEKEIMIEDATKLVFILNNIAQCFKDEAALATLQNEYQDAWNGVGIIAPAGEESLLAAPVQTGEVIQTAQQEDETEDED